MEKHLIMTSYKSVAMVAARTPRIFGQFRVYIKNTI